MDNIIETIYEDQVANSQSTSDLRVDLNAREPETRIDEVNTIEPCPSLVPEEFPAPIGKLLGLSIIRSGSGRATVEFEAGAQYANPREHFMAECSAI